MGSRSRRGRRQTGAGLFPKRETGNFGAFPEQLRTWEVLLYRVWVTLTTTLSSLSHPRSTGEEPEAPRSQCPRAWRWQSQDLNQLCLAHQWCSLLGIGNAGKPSPCPSPKPGTPRSVPEWAVQSGGQPCRNPRGALGCSSASAQSPGLSHCPQRGLRRCFLQPPSSCGASTAPTPSPQHPVPGPGPLL